MKIPLALFPE
jgi:hypothetical protein